MYCTLCCPGHMMREEVNDDFSTSKSLWKVQPSVLWYMYPSYVLGKKIQSSGRNSRWLFASFKFWVVFSDKDWLFDFRKFTLLTEGLLLISYAQLVFHTKVIMHCIRYWAALQMTWLSGSTRKLSGGTTSIVWVWSAKPMNCLQWLRKVAGSPIPPLVPTAQMWSQQVGELVLKFVL